MIMSELKKTIFLDIDGCIFKHHGNLHVQMLNPPELLPGVIDKLNDWEIEGYKIVLTTGRKETLRELTEKQLQSRGVFYDQLVMGLGRGARVVINDLKPGSDTPTAVSVCIKRNVGLENIII
jgi:phosphoglycolate phosphatase-like HAD superfamily hydrolase